MLFNKMNMKIDRHNYEEYFILYWDKELTTAQKQAVENFVQENADLQDEFRLFGETRFAPEAAVDFGDKEFLLENSSVNITNLEEQLLNYIDNELPSDDEKLIEKYASQYPAVKKELEILQKTKLQPESAIVFGDKSVLYRKEEKPENYRVPVIRMTWFRVAVAAAIILIAGFATLRLINTGNSNEEIIPLVKAGEKKESPGNNENSQPAVLSKDQQSNNDAKAIKDNTASAKKEKETPKLPVENLVAGSLAVNKVENKNNLPKEGSGLKNKLTEENNYSDLANTYVDMPALKQKDFTTAEKYKTELTANPDVTIQPGYALNLQEPAIDEKGISANNQKEKGGIKEFLRKTTRMFERRTKIQATTDDNKLLVGAFAVSLK
jgi:hypothetical protein